MPGTELSTIAKSVNKMLFLPSMSFLPDGEYNQGMSRRQGAECPDLGISEQEGWARAGKMRLQLIR